MTRSGFSSTLGPLALLLLPKCRSVAMQNRPLLWIAVPAMAWPGLAVTRVCAHRSA